MPVSTDTLRDQNKLHLIFAVSAVVLLVSMVWLVWADYSRVWRHYQRDARHWETAMTVDAGQRALTADDQRQLKSFEQEIDTLAAALPHERIAELEAKLAATQSHRDRLTLPAATVKGEIGPKTQELERAQLAGSDQVGRIEAALERLNENYGAKERELVALDMTIAGYEQELVDLRAQQVEINRQIANLTRAKDAAAEKLTKIDPQGLAKVSDRVRNAPLLDWFNPTEKVQQVVVPSVRIDLNFLTVETIDRCTTCHVNIDNPAYDEDNLLLFAERQAASYEGQDVDAIDQPVVLRSFWDRAAELAGLGAKLEKFRAQAFESVNELRQDAGMGALESVLKIKQELDRIAQHEPGDDGVSRKRWYAPVAQYTGRVKQLLRESLGEDEFKKLRSLYRYELVDYYNRHRSSDSLPTLSANPVLLAHPKLGLYANAESSHPMKTMGCTVCHEGSGQETGFVHAAHTPRDAWVDARSGAPVPRFLMDRHGDGHAGMVQAAYQPKQGFSLDGATVAYASGVREGDGHGQDGHSQTARSTHADVKLTDPHNPAPFAPSQETHGHTAAYKSVGHEAGELTAVPQAEFWADRYGWHAVHYMEWEKPMHALDYVESSCNKCHTEVFDIDQAAPTLFKGRLLFSQLGCVNCHAVESLNDDLDIKKIGPNLAHLKHKLSKPMAASWIWSPKAFRPTAKMPHYFMLENNSSPVDIQRTRTEVAAMTHYLYTSKPAKTTPAYKPEPQPDGVEGDAAAGRKLFNSVGCLSCHTNISEQGQKWAADDMVARQGMDREKAEHAYESMSYNQQRWYITEHLPQKVSLIGPDLSDIGTKLTAGRDTATAREEAAGWLYDWLSNPRHYSSYTIMPSFRLSQQEAADMAAYLLSLTRPDYEAQDFLAMGDSDKKMLAELVAQLKAAGSTVELARKEAARMKHDEQLAYLGKKMIAHYGCNGCHLINGFETAASACANLDDWGLKDPHKLDFGYFDHAFDADREHPIAAWKVDHEGLEADAPQVTYSDKKIHNVSLNWEHMPALDRRPWLYHKLHNPRVYDRGRTAFEGALDPSHGFDAADSDVGKPYDKLKMPKFFLADDQVRALITFVTSIRKPLVDPTMQQSVMGEARMRLARGRQVATLYNCYGCHNVEHNEPRIWDSFDVYNPDGGFNYENLNNAPPRLIGQGAKTQPQWLYHFLHNIEPLRPWLKVRMPSFPLDAPDTTALVDYFAGASQEITRRMAGPTAAVEQAIENRAKMYLESVDGLSKEDVAKKLNKMATPQRVAYLQQHNKPYYWFQDPALAQAVERIKAFAIEVDLVRPSDLDPLHTPLSERATKWAKVLGETRFSEAINDIAYPFVPTPAFQGDAQWFARGEKLFKELRCYQCHALGDEQTLQSLWELDNPAEEADAAAEADDSEEEDDYGYGDEEEDDYGYGDEEEAEAAPTGPVYTAPNLSLTARRLQWQWVDSWLQEPATIQPGTKMPQWFPGGQSAFNNYPGQAKDQMHATYGYLGKDQRKLLLDFMYEAGRTGYTPGAERLTGAESVEVELPPLPKPEMPDEGEDGEPGEQSAAATDGDDGGAAQAAAPVPVTPKEEPKVSSITLHDATAPYDGQGKGRVVGVIKFDGKPPRRKPIRMSADAFCNKAHDEKVFDPSTIVNDDGTVQNAFVYVKSGLSGSFSPPSTQVVMDQVGCMYRPHVVGVMAGQPLLILNSDNTLHNVKMNSSSNGSFNEGMPVQGMQIQKTLSKQEMGISFKCDVHPWMGALLYVTDHPFFGVSDVEGRFEIKGLPPGTYTLEVVHENKKIAPVTFDVTVQADTSHREDATLNE